MRKRTGRARAIAAALKKWLRSGRDQVPEGALPGRPSASSECIACGEGLAPALAHLGSLRCHDCKRPAEAAVPLTVSR